MIISEVKVTEDYLDTLCESGKIAKTDINKEIALKMLNGYTFDRLYREGYTKTAIKSTYRSLGKEILIENGWKWHQCKIERALIDLSKEYSYMRNDYLIGCSFPFDYIVYNDNIPVLCIEYLGPNNFPIKGYYIDEEEYSVFKSKMDIKEKICKERNIPLLKLVFTEVSFMLTSSDFKDAILKNGYAERYYERIMDDFDDDWLTDMLNYNAEEVSENTKCYCFNCGATFNGKDIKKVDYNYSVCCPICEKATIILDSSGIEPLPDFMAKIKKLYDKIHI